MTSIKMNSLKKKIERVFVLVLLNRGNISYYFRECKEDWCNLTTHHQTDKVILPKIKPIFFSVIVIVYNHEISWNHGVCAGQYFLDV